MPTMTPGAKLTTFEQEAFRRAMGAEQPQLGVTTRDGRPDWFGPGEPMVPQAPSFVKGRRFDFPVTVNMVYTPKGEQGEGYVSFDTLRRMADPALGGLDLLRTAINTRKNQMCAQKWAIRGLDPHDDGGPKAREMEKWLRKPDGINRFPIWVRPLVEDHLVIGQAALYRRPSAKPFSYLEVVDAATIKRLVDENGRTPMPPEFAYQQRLKGVVAAEYTLEELILTNWDSRSYRIYPMGRVEHVINIVNLALKRHVTQISYYTEGNVPEALIAVPESWTPEQLKAFQAWWDETTSDLEERSKAKFVPGGTAFNFTRDPQLKDEMDEWLARIIAYAFDLPVQALVKEMNRATAETAAQSAAQEGTETEKIWLKATMDDVVELEGGDGLQFSWQDEEISDPEKKMKVWTGYKAAGFITADEGRAAALNMPALTPDQKDELNPPPPPGLGMGLEAPGDPAGKPGAKPGTSQGEAKGRSSASASELPPASKKGEPAEKVEKAEKKKKVSPTPAPRAATRRAESRIKAAIKAYLVKVRKVMVAGILADSVAKADHPKVISILSTVPKAERDKLIRKISDELGAVAEDSAERGLGEIALVVPPDEEAALDAMLSQANEKAIAWAEERAAELVTEIDATTRDRLSDLVTEAMEEGWSNDELASKIEDGELFGEYRSEVIARTETAFADVQGNITGWKETGVVAGMQWITGGGECDICKSLNGKIAGLDEEFQSDDGESYGPPPDPHPNCRCTVIPVLTSQEEE